MVLSRITEKEWMLLEANKYKKDCCPCVLRLIGIPAGDASAMVEHFGKDAGMVEDDLLHYFRSKYPDFKFSINAFNLIDRGSSVQLLSEIYNGLPHGHGGVCAFRRGPESNYTGHCIILYKNDAGEYLILDVQAQAVYHGEDAIIQYFDKNNIIQINTIHSSHTKYKYPLVFWINKGALRKTDKRKKTKRKKTKRKKTKRKKTKRKKTKRKKIQDGS